jgi:hypothetical protein
MWSYNLFLAASGSLIARATGFATEAAALAALAVAAAEIDSTAIVSNTFGGAPAVRGTVVVGWPTPLGHI